MHSDGVFVDCRTHWKGRIGESAVSLAKYQGGTISIGNDGRDQGLGLAGSILSIAARLRLTCTSEQGSSDYGRPVLIRQENDPNPKFHFLEEGPVRLGMRVAFDLLDDENHYHGDGRLDLWTYAEGDMHLACNLQLVDQKAHSVVHDAYIEVVADLAYHKLQVGEELLEQGSETVVSIGTDLANRRILLGGDEQCAALYWVRDQGHVWDVGCDHGERPPFYASRWPTGMQQWSKDGMGWTCQGNSAAVTTRLEHSGPNIRLSWLRNENLPATTTHTAMLVASVGHSLDELNRRIDAVQNPLNPTVDGGTFRCYTEEDGTYEIGQGDPSGADITFPVDPLKRQVRLRFYRRKTDPRHCGGIVAQANGKSLRTQLMSEGELVDDICVPMEMSHRNHPVDDVFVTVRLDACNPTTITIDKTPGIQATYQSEIAGLDLQRRAGNRRDVVIWSSRNKRAPLMEFDLFSNAVHRLTSHHETNYVVWEMPMAWFKSCGISKHEYCNHIKAFSIEENGPEAVSLYTRSTNPNQRAQSELWLRIPYHHPRPRLEVRMRLEILEQWDYENIEFTDIFPYPSRLTETWFHDAVLFVQPGRTYVKHSLKPDLSDGRGIMTTDEQLFYALYASDRGNVLTFIRNLQHSTDKMHYSVCGNYIDIHVNFHPGSIPLGPGHTFDVEYVCEVFGDSTTTVDELVEIGRSTLASGDLQIP